MTTEHLVLAVPSKGRLMEQTIDMFGKAGLGLFPAPSVIEEEICQQYRVRPVGQLAEVSECFFAISVERRLKHPAVVAISEAARTRLFG